MTEEHGTPSRVGAGLHVQQINASLKTRHGFWREMWKVLSVSTARRICRDLLDPLRLRFSGFFLNNCEDVFV